MVDGMGGTIKPKDGAASRIVDFDAAYADRLALILRAGDHLLVFGREADFEGALKKLRVDRPDNWEAPPPGFQWPWSKT